MSQTIFLLLCVVSALANPLIARDSVTALVDLSISRGTPQHLASGFLYGIPDKEGQIPDHWYTDIDFNYGRTGGAQMGAPNRGWVYGTTEYKGRLASTLSNYRTCRKYNASVILYPHDLFGTDNTNSSSHWPGDNGDWADYDKFVKQFMNDLAANNALDGLVWDIWNEPDINIFWKGKGGMQQWIDLYIRTHKIIRADARFNKVKISGPSLAYRPMSSNAWWTGWLKQIAKADTIPDQWSYHLEGALNAVDNDPQYTNSSLGALLKQYGLPDRETCINEYAEYSEMFPSGYAWWISRLERLDFSGVLGNWQGGTVLHDLFANLLTKKSKPRDYGATDYAGAPGYWVYKYYAQNMTGHRVKTTGSSDNWFDVYGTVGDRVRLLAGAKIKTGSYKIQVNKLSSVGLPTSGILKVDLWSFSGTNQFAVQAAPAFRGTTSTTYSGDSVTISISQTDTTTGWAVEFSV